MVLTTDESFSIQARRERRVRVIFAGHVSREIEAD
jgi:hypothetical protein